MTDTQTTALSQTDKAEFDDAKVTWPERAKAFVVNSQETYAEAGDKIQVVKALRKKVAETFRPIIKQAHATWKAALASEAEYAGPLEQAEKLYKTSAARWKLEQDRLVAEANERNRLEQEEKRRTAEEAECKANAEREAAFAKLRQGGKAMDAMLDIGEADAAIVSARQQAAEAEALSHAKLAPAVQKVDTMTVIDNWKVDTVDLMELVKYVASGATPLAFVTANLSALNAIASEHARVPGVTFKNEPTVRSRR